MREALRSRLTLFDLANGDLCWRVVQLLSIIMVWFFFQGNGCADVAQASETLAFGRFCDSMALCLGGIAGSILFLLIGGTSSRLPSKLAMRMLGVLAVGALASFILALEGQFVWATIARTASSAIITVLFLDACILLVGVSARGVLEAFLLVSACRIIQCALFLIPLGAFEKTVLFGVLMFSLLIPYVNAFKRTQGTGTVKDFPSAFASGGSNSSCAETTGENNEKIDAGKSDPGLPWQFILHVTLFYFAINIASSWEVQLISDVERIPFPYLLGTVISFVLFYWVFVKTGNTSDYWVRMRQIVFPLGFLAFIFICFPGSEAAYFVAVVMAQGAYRFFLLSSYVEMFSIVSITRIRSERVFAIVHIAMYFGMLLGTIYAASIRQYVPWSQGHVVGTMALVFVCFVIGSCWLGSDKQAAKVWGRRVKLTPQGKHDLIMREKCSCIADAYQLTPKERDVLGLLAEGKKTSQIASSLYVSQNTVRTHLRNLYGKLDVHSREEFLSFFDSYEA